MAAIRFQLLYPNETEKIQSVYMIISIGDSKRIRIRVPNIQVKFNQWDRAKGRVKMIKEIETRFELNAIIDEMEFNVKKAISEIERRQPPATYEKIKDAINKLYPSKREKTSIEKSEKTNEAENVTFWQFVEKFIKDLPTKVHQNGKTTAKQTVKNYSTAISCLKQFEAKYGKKIDFHSFDVAFISEYKAYLTNEKQHKPNTIDKKVRTINSLLDYAFESDLHENIAYKTRKEFKTRRENVDNVYLNEKELAEIENYDFSANEKLDNVRDWFLIACWTGLRFSDLDKLKKEFVTNNSITIEQKKTSQKVTVRLNLTETVPKILAKRKGDFPHLISNQKFNEYVKDMLKIVGIDTPTIKYETIGGKRISTTKPKYEFVAAHTARRTFATNLYLRNVPIGIIMAATGHKTIESFMKYVKASEAEKQGDLKSYMK